MTDISIIAIAFEAVGAGLVTGGSVKALRAVDSDVLTIGQNLRPTAEHLPLVRYYTPAEFNEMRDEALALGFKHVESGPLVRSSYHARDQVPAGSPALRGRRAERASA
jgi:lipoic acid synthetase